eukprot:15366142-Ditylum_brightwellii.AAC.1
MRTAPTTKQQSKPDVKQAVIAFTRPMPRQLKCGQFHMYKLRTTLADTNSPIYKLSIPFFDEGLPKEWIKFWCGLQAVLKGQNVTQGPPSYAVAKTLLKGNVKTVFEQAEITHGNQTVPHFKLCLDAMAAHVFLEKAGQTQKCYMWRNICYSGGTTLKEWVARVLELNGYLKDFPAPNENPTQPLDAHELVSASWCGEFMVQGFDPVDQGLHFFGILHMSRVV